MMAGILMYTTDGLYVDTIFQPSPGGGAPGYRKDCECTNRTPCPVWDGMEWGGSDCIAS